MNKVIFLDHDGVINSDAENACLKLVKTVPNVCFKIDEICFSEKCYENLAEADKIYGDVYAYRDKLERVIGYIVYGQVWIPADDNNAYISRIGILPAYRRRGHAAQMLQLAEVDLRARKCPSIHADIREDNIVSRSLFENSGYSPIWEDNELFDGFKAIRYAKPLGIEDVEFLKPNPRS